MKKSTLLSLATAGAIVATSAGTFALWDTLSDTASGKLTVRNPVTVTASSMADFTAVTPETEGQNPAYEGKATFNLVNVEASKYKISSTVVVKDGASDVTDQLDIVQTGNDAVIASEASKDITVKITPKDTATTLAGKELTVEVTGSLVENK